MDIDIKLQNQCLPWNYFSKGSLKFWWKGTIFLHNKSIKIDDFVDFFDKEKKHQNHNLDQIEKFLHQLNGSFTFIIETSDFILCAVDRIRSIPLFYSSLENTFTISDSAHYIVQCLPTLYNKEKGAELLSALYVTGPNTLFDGVEQLQAGEFLFFNKMDVIYSVRRYFHYFYSDFSDTPEQLLINRLDDIMGNIFKRLIETTVMRGKIVVVPLSGGLDSRLIAGLLKRFGIEDVICYSYGKKDNYESKISEKVAKALGYEWHFVDYKKNSLYESYHSEEMRAYEKYAGNFTSVPHIQDYLAVKVLKEEGMIPANAVFVPGHTGDMISGGHIPLNIEEIAYNYDQFINDIIKRHYVNNKRNKRDENELENIFRQRIKRAVGDITVNNSESYANGIEYFDFNERQTKWIVNSVRVYEFFGFDWRIPLWDAELIEFFLSIPLSLKLNQSLYKKYVFEKAFKGGLEYIMQIPCTSIEQRKYENIFLKYLFQKIPLIKIIGMEISARKRAIVDPMNFHTILSKKNYIIYYLLRNMQINSYLSHQYLKFILNDNSVLGKTSSENF